MAGRGGPLLALAFLALSACSSGGTSTPPPADSDGSAGGACTFDVQCAGETPRCDTATGRCVPCLPERDNCPPGTHCARRASSYACTATCESAAECARSDAGAPGSCCNATCVDTATDRANCGGCGTACPAVAGGSAACVAGACVARCEARFADCNGMIGDGCEVDVTADIQHCGGCRMACPPPAHAQAACVAGRCAIAGCDPGFADCNQSAADGCEADTERDVAHCGACGNTCAVPHATATCVAGRCAAGACDAGFADCDGLGGNGCEVPIASDVNNCGACARACQARNGTPGCALGACTVAACNPGFADCNGDVSDGCETAVGKDVNSCGGCGKRCPAIADGTPGCVNGTCVVASCRPGFGDCDAMFANGCEASLQSPQSCGACNVRCPAPPNAAAACANGMCGVGACNPPFADCDRVPQNGCERDLANDFVSCGACGVICSFPNAIAGCVAATCVVSSCVPGYGDCDRKPANGCEVRTTFDVAHCGGCGQPCPAAPNSTPICFNAACSIVCDADFGDCDRMAANGCEVALRSDVKHCGACGAACAPVANGTSGCASGLCNVASCNPGFGDCDQLIGTGCERNLESDVFHCGGCGRACLPANAVAACNSGQCAVASCKAGFADCDGAAGNGCEIQITNDVFHCGGCGRACPVVANATPTCAGAACGFSCIASFADCDKVAGNGCEASLQTSVDHCGGCGAACANVANGARGCVGGRCVIAACNAGFADCDMSLNTGCERNLNSDVNHCGACGRACALPNAVAGCANGACTIVACNAGFADCDGKPANGCEAELKSDPRNCNGCGNACPGQNAYCNAGVCGKCIPDVLVIGDQSVAANNSFVTALQNAGMVPTLSQDNYTYAGVPAAGNFGATVVLVGNQYNNNMPAAGQNSIVAAQKAGSGVVFVEFASLLTRNGQWATLLPLTLIGRTGANAGKASFTLTAANHPLWTGIPNTFKLVNEMGITSISGLINGGVEVASCTMCQGAGLAAREHGNGGRLVHVNLAVDYTGAFLGGDLMWNNDPNATRMMVNAALWAAHCL